MKPINSANDILVIKHGALGDFILALPAMAAIRARFPDAHIAVQTTPLLIQLCDACPYIDEIDPGGRPKGLKAMMGLASRVRAGKYDIVYDLQNSERTAFLKFLLGPFPPKWNGIAGGASHRVHDAHRLQKHVVERMAEQVALTGVPAQSALTLPDLSWAAAKGNGPDVYGLNGPYMLLTARASAGHPGKQWPAERFAAIAKRALEEGTTPVLIGTEEERDGLQVIADIASGTLNLAGKTSLCDVAALGAKAKGVLGNDTGPTFIAAAAGAPSVVFYSRHSLKPDVCAPRGPGGVLALTGKDVTDITVDAAEQALGMLGVFKRA
jgi:ADP-heptose:LPS heptosyltransferase